MSRHIRTLDGWNEQGLAKMQIEPDKIVRHR